MEDLCARLQGVRCWPSLAEMVTHSPTEFADTMEARMAVGCPSLMCGWENGVAVGTCRCATSCQALLVRCETGLGWSVWGERTVGGGDPGWPQRSSEDRWRAKTQLLTGRHPPNGRTSVGVLAQTRQTTMRSKGCAPGLVEGCGPQEGAADGRERVQADVVRLRSLCSQFVVDVDSLTILARNFDFLGETGAAVFLRGSCNGAASGLTSVEIDGETCDMRKHATVPLGRLFAPQLILSAFVRLDSAEQWTETRAELLRVIRLAWVATSREVGHCAERSPADVLT